LARILASNNFCLCRADASAPEHLDLVLPATYLYAPARDFAANVVKVQSALKSSGTSPNFLITVASLKSPVNAIQIVVQLPGTQATRCSYKKWQGIVLGRHDPCDHRCRAGDGLVTSRSHTKMILSDRCIIASMSRGRLIGAAQ
jgi:hypothetical protein